MTDYWDAHLIGTWLGVSPRTVRRWAKEDGWRTQGKWPHLTYNIDDAAASNEARRGVAVL